MARSLKMEEIELVCKAEAGQSQRKLRLGDQFCFSANWSGTAGLSSGRRLVREVVRGPLQIVQPGPEVLEIPDLVGVAGAGKGLF